MLEYQHELQHPGGYDLWDIFLPALTIYLQLSLPLLIGNFRLSINFRIPIMGLPHLDIFDIFKLSGFPTTHTNAYTYKWTGEVSLNHISPSTPRMGRKICRVAEYVFEDNPKSRPSFIRETITSLICMAAITLDCAVTPRVYQYNLLRAQLCDL